MTEATDIGLTRHADGSSQTSRTILVADDIPMFRELAALFLARSALVVTAETGDEAIQVARRVRPDLILSDLHMPGMKGDELCRIVKADPDLAHVPVIVMIGPHEGEDRARAVLSGADDLLVKPLNRVGLIEAVNRFVRWSEVRGLPRIDCSLPVGVAQNSVTTWGTARNLSRGGLYLETANPAELESEVRLRFALPELPREFRPTAQVIWRNPHDPDPADPTDQALKGMGLRFLEIDGAAERQLDDYVFQHRFSRELPLMGELP